MATKKKQVRKSALKRADPNAKTELRGPAGRGGAAMGRTVGLPFGGARARKRKPGNKSGPTPK